MAVAAERTPEVRPSLADARELARSGNAIPIRMTFVDDCETPVSAFLKLRDGGPCFLLESAEQGRLGRYSFLGFRPRAMLRYSDGELREWRGDVAPDAEPVSVREVDDPYGAVSEYLAAFRLPPLDDLPPFAGGAVGFFGYDLVRTVEPLAEPNPDPIGLPDMALMVSDVLVVFDHMRHELTLMAYAIADDESELESAYASAVETLSDLRERLRGPVPRPATSGIVRGTRVRVEHDAGGVRGERPADHRVHLRRGRVPGGPLAALLGAHSRRGVLDLPRPAHGQPVALHVLPRLRRLPARRRLAGAPGEGHRKARRDEADRRHLSARGRARRRTAGGRRTCSATRRSGPST